MLREKEFRQAQTSLSGPTKNVQIKLMKSQKLFSISIRCTPYFIIQQGLLKPHLEWDSVFTFHAMEHYKRDKGADRKSPSDIPLMSLPRLAFLGLDLNENECVPVTDLYQRYLITFHKNWKVNNAFYILFHSGRLTVKQGMTCNPVYLCFTEHWDSN